MWKITQKHLMRSIRADCYLRAYLLVKEKKHKNAHLTSTWRWPENFYLTSCGYVNSTWVSTSLITLTWQNVCTHFTSPHPTKLGEHPIPELSGFVCPWALSLLMLGQVYKYMFHAYNLMQDMLLLKMFLKSSILVVGTSHCSVSKMFKDVRFY